MDRLLVAYRYLVTRPISIVSVLGVLVGLGAIVVVDSVMNGFLHQQQALAYGIKNQDRAGDRGGLILGGELHPPTVDPLPGC